MESGDVSEDGEDDDAGEDGGGGVDGGDDEAVADDGAVPLVVGGEGDQGPGRDPDAPEVLLRRVQPYLRRRICGGMGGGQGGMKWSQYKGASREAERAFEARMSISSQPPEIQSSLKPAVGMRSRSRMFVQLHGKNPIGELGFQ